MSNYNLLTQPGFQDLLTRKRVDEKEEKPVNGRSEELTRKPAGKPARKPTGKPASASKSTSKPKNRLNLTNFDPDLKRSLAIAARERDTAMVRLLEEIVEEWLVSIHQPS